MGEKKVTKMLVKGDLQCSKCYKKIKKVLCGIHQIRDQVYDDKANAVLITVVCCSPEKIKEKIWCKGGNTILGIEAPKNKEAPKPLPAPAPKPLAPIGPCPGYPVYGLGCCCYPCCHGYGGGPCYGYWYGRPPPMCYYEENPFGCMIM